MKVCVSDIKETPGLTKDIHMEITDPLEELVLDGPVKVVLRVQGGGDGCFQVDGSVCAQVRLVCSRCAREYVENVKADVEERFVPASSAKLVDNEEVEAEDLCVFGYENDELEIDELARENLIASLPYRPLCCADCRGVCPVCGQNLNDKVCECETSEPVVDPRWGDLKKFSVDSPQK